MTYEETLDFLYSQLPMYQRQGKSAYKKDLGNTIALLSSLGNPHREFRSIHIAGTNGKGSSAHLLSSILQSSGYKVGLYTSPHLKEFTERIKINGQEVSKDFVIGLVARIKKSIDEIKPSFFELTVAMAFCYFQESKVDIAVIETGLGGRLDSTNVIDPEVSLITNIGFDHMDMLGDTLEKIATEKAGIIKKNKPVIIGSFQEETFPVFVQKATNESSKLVLGSYVYSMNREPYFVRKNVSGVLSVIEELKNQCWNIPDDKIHYGIKNITKLTNFKGRFQVLNEKPLVIADVSHNYDGLNLLIQEVEKVNRGKVKMIFGSVKDKNLSELFQLFPKDWDYIWTQSKVPRSLTVNELNDFAKKKGFDCLGIANVNEAISIAKEQSNPYDTIVVTGSTFVVSEIKDL